MKSTDPQGLWPVDRLILGYLLVTSAVIAAFSRQVPHSGPLLLAHAAGMILIVAAAFRPEWPGAEFFRYWYPILYVSACYREMSLLIPAIRGRDFDATLAVLDYAILGVHPAVLMERIQTPLLTEILQIAYSLFIPSVLLIGGIYWIRGDKAELRRYSFLITLGFLVSYIGYFVVPARGPRFHLAGLHTKPLEGLWLYRPLRDLLDALESAHYDCFPSGHIELTMLAWWWSRRISPALFHLYSVYTLSILVATVYLRYHYAFDLFAGVVVATALLAVVAPGGNGEQGSRWIVSKS